MPISPYHRRVSRAAVAALGAAGLFVLSAAPAAFGDENGPELAVGGFEPVNGVKPGGGFDVPATVVNRGTEAVEKVWVSYSVTRGLDFTEIPSNCWVQHVPSYDEMPERWTAVCGYDHVVEPGVVYTPEKPLGVKVLDRALNEEVRLRVGDIEPAADDNGTVPVTGAAPAVKLVEAQAGAGVGSKEVVDVPVTAVNTADYQVTGDALKGRVGDTVTMKVKFIQAGPAWVQPREGDPVVKVTVTPPPGTSVVKPGMFCQAKGKASYGCGYRSLNEGREETYTFELKIDKRVAGAKGSIALSTEARPFDPDKANDKADITLDVVGGGSSGSTGGSGSSGGSTGGSTGGSSGGSSGGSDGSTGGSAGGSTHGSGGSAGGYGATDDGALAATGSSMLPITGVAAAAVVAGAGTLLVARRRRGQSVS